MDSSNSSDSNKSKNSLDIYFKDNKTTLKSIDEIKKEAFKEKDKPINYNSIFDIDSKINYLLIEEQFKSGLPISEKINYFYKKMYLLNFSDRIKLYNKYNQILMNSEEQKKYKNTNIIQKRSTKEIFKDVLKLISEHTPPNDFQNSLCTNNYISQIPECFIPINEGNEEIIFSYLIINIFTALCEKKSLPEDTEKRRKIYRQNINNFIPSENTKNKKEKYKKSFLVKKSESNKPKDGKKVKSGNNINNNKESQLQNFKGQQNNKYYKKILLLKPIIDIYLSEEFNKNREYYLERLKNKEKELKRIHYIYEIAIDLLLYCLVEFPDELISSGIEKFRNYYYENMSEKILSLKFLLSLSNSKLYEDENTIIDDIKYLENKDYIIKFTGNSNRFIVLNPYDYVLTYLCKGLSYYSYDEICYKMKDNKYFSLQKCAFTNNLFKLNETNNYFENYLDKIMNHDILRRTFSQLKQFSNVSYPFDSEQLKEQIKNNLFFIPFPTPFLSGLTLKKFGVILININRFYSKIDEADNIVLRFIKKLCETGFILVTLIHEINFHYFLVILYSNNHLNLKTPRHLFNDYNIEEKYYTGEDAGEMGEILLFGQPIKIFYLNGLYNFLSLNIWNKYEEKNPIDFIELGNDFLENNEENYELELKYKDFVNINDFTNQLNIEIEEDMKYNNFNNSNNIINENTNLLTFFSKGKILEEGDVEDEFYNNIFTFAQGKCITRHGDEYDNYKIPLPK